MLHNLISGKKTDLHYKLQKSAHYCKQQTGEIKTNNEETCRITTNKSIPAYADSKVNALSTGRKIIIFKVHIDKTRLLVKQKVCTNNSLKRLSH